MTSHFPLVEKENKLVPCSKGIPSLVEEIWNNSTMCTCTAIKIFTKVNYCRISICRACIQPPPPKKKKSIRGLWATSLSSAKIFNSIQAPRPLKISSRISQEVQIDLAISGLIVLSTAKPKLCHIRKSL